MGKRTKPKAAAAAEATAGTTVAVGKCGICEFPLVEVRPGAVGHFKGETQLVQQMSSVTITERHLEFERTRWDRLARVTDRPLTSYGGIQ